MSEPRISVERFIRIYDDNVGSYLEIGADRDGLDLCQITQVDPGSKPIEILIPWPHAEKLGQALLELAAKQ